MSLKERVVYQPWGEVDLVAVYGTLREGFGNHARLQGAEKLSTERVEGFGMKAMGFPAIYDKDGKEITIEVYRTISDEQRNSLDGLEGYYEGGDFYDRKLIDTTQGKAWIYFMSEEGIKNLPEIEDGDFTKYVRNERRG